MGAFFFFQLMVALFLAASFFIILNIKLIINWRAQKRNGKAPQKRFLVIPIVFLVVSITIELVPIVWFGLLRTSNGSRSNDIVMAESGKIVYWGYSENGDVTTNKFEMDGITYIDTNYNGSSDTWKLGKPVANIKFKSDIFDKIMDIIFAYDDTSTLYPVINNGGSDLYTIGSRIYCPENQKDLFIDYYEDLSNYDTQNIIKECGLYQGADDTDDIIFITTDITLKQNVFEELYEIKDTQERETTMIVPEKYIQIRDAKVPGTPFEGFDEETLYSYSNDGVMYKYVSLALIDGQIYLVMGSGPETVSGYRLPQEVNDYLKLTIFPNG